MENDTVFIVRDQVSLHCSMQLQLEESRKLASYTAALWKPVSMIVQSKYQYHMNIQTSSPIICRVMCNAYWYINTLHILPICIHMVLIFWLYNHGNRLSLCSSVAGKFSRLFKLAIAYCNRVIPGPEQWKCIICQCNQLFLCNPSPSLNPPPPHS